MLWEHPAVRYYSHEPFEATYYREAQLDDAIERITDPLDLAPYTRRTQGDGLVIKDMPYQVGANFPLLAALATPPLVFLLRDPRLAIASRMRKKVEVGDPPIFPEIESGWQLIGEQISYCREEGLELRIVEAADFRNRPREVFAELLAAFDLPFSDDLLLWRACSDVELDNLEGDHSHLYRRVLRSTGLLPAEEPIPGMEHFPAEQGFRDHVSWCLERYRELLEAPERVGAVDSVGAERA